MKATRRADCHLPPATMDHSAAGLAIIADRLKNPMFDSKTVVEIDSAVVVSLFGQRTKKKDARTHQVQTLSVACSFDQETKDTIYRAFEENKEKLEFEDHEAYLQTTRQMAASLYRSCSQIKQYGSHGKAVMEWYALISLILNNS